MVDRPVTQASRLAESAMASAILSAGGDDRHFDHEPRIGEARHD